MYYFNGHIKMRNEHRPGCESECHEGDIETN